jgi:hypothetical protein
VVIAAGSLPAFSSELNSWIAPAPAPFARIWRIALVGPWSVNQRTTPAGVIPFGRLPAFRPALK